MQPRCLPMTAHSSCRIPRLSVLMGVTCWTAWGHGMPSSSRTLPRGDIRMSSTLLFTLFFQVGSQLTRQPWSLIKIMNTTPAGTDSSMSLAAGVAGAVGVFTNLSFAAAGVLLNCAASIVSTVLIYRWPPPPHCPPDALCISVLIHHHEGRAASASPHAPARCSRSGLPQPYGLGCVCMHAASACPAPATSFAGLQRPSPSP